MGPALRRIGEQMIEYTYMPMLEPNALRDVPLETCLDHSDGFWGYNELVLDAVAIDSRASRVTFALARAVQDAASVANGLPLPLLEYNPGNAAAPFRVLRALPAE
ncbi:hypothetical protein EMIHUDRAFT_239204 [Emiliania huxleyi CCMP1516]|uniref:Uncharacterized protein n=2 Tax=Emiliania huxleyi TaxID=2903 RepID=A0A0D3JJN1_EMIH1|nr:hypothetical protein EMIHUDRAFT_239204 [Emiliania huxleyi CCMP1516]EOD23716.1 hypothetical protein EMIHUDRAFT_239204 [Emiliania huxleyi CCMP1516]|eukprot:XP_005776145.1 hypothetical protein EMIHUDRAFT_239204 [Emiliania huxleyi CCMP1516]